MTMPFSQRHLDILTETVNIGVGRAASILNDMLGSHVALHVPRLTVYDAAGLRAYLSRYAAARLSSVQMPFTAPFAGVAALVFPPESASQLVYILAGEEYDPAEMDAIRKETLNEVGNIVLNGVMGSVGNMLDTRIDYAVPRYAESDLNGLITASGAPVAAYIMAEATFEIQDHKIEGDVLLLFEVDSFDTLLKALDSLVS